MRKSKKNKPEGIDIPHILRYNIISGTHRSPAQTRVYPSARPDGLTDGHERTMGLIICTEDCNNMKVILKTDVKGSGKKGDIIEVSEGYAKNFLLKKNLAEPATAASMNEALQKKQALEFHKAEELKVMQALAASLKGKKITLAIKTGENGKLFGSVTSAQIAQELAAAGFDVDKKKILLKEPIKTLGTYTVNIRLMEKVETEITVEVVAA